MIRRALLAAAALLVLFHAWIFAAQVLNGQLTDASLLFRWLVAGGLVAALVALRRHGISIFRGRRAVAIWVLAALLHGPAAARRLDTVGEPAVPDFVATLTEFATAFGLALTLAAALGRFRSPRNGVARGIPAIPASPPRWKSSRFYAFTRFSPRPPPLSL
jgi:hypothetical protein